MATSDDWTKPFWNINGGGGEKHGMPDKGSLSFDLDGANLKIFEIKDDKDGKGNKVVCGWGTIPYAFVSGSSNTKIQGQIGSKTQPFVIELKGTSPNQTLECKIDPLPPPPPPTPTSSSGFDLTWLKKLLKALLIHSASGDAGSWTAVEGGLR